MEVPPEIIAGVEGNLCRNGGPAAHYPRMLRERQSLLMSKGGAARECDLEGAQEDGTMRTRADL